MDVKQQKNQSMTNILATKNLKTEKKKIKNILMFVNIQVYHSSKLRFYKIYILKNYISRKWTLIINQYQYIAFTKVNKQKAKVIISIILEWLN